MQFEEGFLYHIYNQGNNKQKIFFNDDNYTFFLQKIRKYILPYADILAWCLMPNHFHLMVFVKKLGVSQRHAEFDTRTLKKLGASQRRTEFGDRTFNSSIGIMLMAYTKAFNKQNNRTGKLFREKTKAECLNCLKGITPSFINENGITKINISNPEKQYPKICFDYIHQNPVKAKLVKNAEDWIFSSAKDYKGLRNGTLVNKELAEKLGVS